MVGDVVEPADPVVGAGGGRLGSRFGHQALGSIELVILQARPRASVSIDRCLGFLARSRERLVGFAEGTRCLFATMLGYLHGARGSLGAAPGIRLGHTSSLASFGS